MKHARPDYQRIQDPENKIPEDEPVFLIRGQDKIGAATVRMWAELALAAGADPAMVASAWNHAKEMDLWQAKHGKVPDLES